MTDKVQIEKLRKEINIVVSGTIRRKSEVKERENKLILNKIKESIGGNKIKIDHCNCLF